MFVGISMPIICFILLIITPNGHGANNYYVLIQVFEIAATFEVTILWTAYEAATLNANLNLAVASLEQWLLVAKETRIDNLDVVYGNLPKLNNDNQKERKKISRNLTLKHINSVVNTLNLIEDVNNVGVLKKTTMLERGMAIELCMDHDNTKSKDTKTKTPNEKIISETFETPSPVSRHQKGVKSETFDGAMVYTPENIQFKRLVQGYMPILAYWKVRFKGVRFFRIRVDFKLFFRLVSISIINVLIFFVRARISWI